MPTTVMSILPLHGATVLQDGDYCVMDNLDQPYAPSIEGQTAGFPLKLSLTAMLIVQEGKVQIRAGFRDCEMTGGSCVMMMPGTIIEHVAMDLGTKAMAIYFPPTVTLSQQVAQYQLIPQHLDMIVGAYRLLRQAVADSALADGKQAVTAQCVSLMTAILEHGATRRDTTKRSRGEEIVSSFLQCVADNYREHRDLGFYAAQLGLTLKYMSHVIYGQTGRHPSKWIKDYVILEAKSMLRSGRYSIQQIADELHFPNQSFFGKYFKEAVGVSPKKWK